MEDPVEAFNPKTPNIIAVFLQEYWENTMPKVCVEIPQHILDDLGRHIGDEKKFVNVSDAVRSACRKMLDQMDEIDLRNGRVKK